MLDDRSASGLTRVECLPWLRPVDRVVGARARGAERVGRVVDPELCLGHCGPLATQDLPRGLDALLHRVSFLVPGNGKGTGSCGAITARTGQASRALGG